MLKPITVKSVIPEENICEFDDGFLLDTHHAICFPDDEMVWLVRVDPTIEPNVFEKVSTFLHLGEREPDSQETNLAIAQRIVNQMNSTTLYEYLTKVFDWGQEVCFDLV